MQDLPNMRLSVPHPLPPGTNQVLKPIQNIFATPISPSISLLDAQQPLDLAIHLHVIQIDLTRDEC